MAAIQIVFLKHLHLKTYDHNYPANTRKLITVSNIFYILIINILYLDIFELYESIL